MAALWPLITFPVSEWDHFSPPSEAGRCGLADCCKPQCPKVLFQGLELRVQQSLLGHQASCFNTLRPEQNGWYFADIFRYILLIGHCQVNPIEQTSVKLTKNTKQWKYASQENWCLPYVVILTPYCLLNMLMGNIDINYAVYTGCFTVIFLILL